ncbi:uncharacterized protein EV420DRAFT_1479703 [Desarmillaria tabescens]|uniref:Uncharacterized protein n=1 Tax=Armillaria tabescens TaxID=1929756 RepID=A0AA39KGK9_ARMTA|nr:uncharacterized protein EV420DRAFT_1479703 [Desarmillaria tabescens]KAK0458428.1 hypothetical protein EV420DRAFT_1479703 [Desarmillaria tabescens]
MTAEKNYQTDIRQQDTRENAVRQEELHKKSVPSPLLFETSWAHKGQEVVIDGAFLLYGILWALREGLSTPLAQCCTREAQLWDHIVVEGGRAAKERTEEEKKRELAKRRVREKEERLEEHRRLEQWRAEQARIKEEEIRREEAERATGEGASRTQ